MQIRCVNLGQLGCIWLLNSWYALFVCDLFIAIFMTMHFWKMALLLLALLCFWLHFLEFFYFILGVTNITFWFSLLLSTLYFTIRSSGCVRPSLIYPPMCLSSACFMPLGTNLLPFSGVLYENNLYRLENCFSQVIHHSNSEDLICFGFPNCRLRWEDFPVRVGLK